jgi:hypothetical protein
MIKKLVLTSALLCGPALANGEEVALQINLSGNLCAEVVSVSELSVGGGGVFEVVCIEYRGGSSTVTYIIDTRDGRTSIVRQ